MLILAIDLGKAKSLACWYQTDDATHEFRTLPTRPADFLGARLLGGLEGGIDGASLGRRESGASGARRGAQER